MAKALSPLLIAFILTTGYCLPVQAQRFFPRFSQSRQYSQPSRQVPTQQSFSQNYSTQDQRFQQGQPYQDQYQTPQSYPTQQTYRGSQQLQPQHQFESAEGPGIPNQNPTIHLRSPETPATPAAKTPAVVTVQPTIVQPVTPPRETRTENFESQIASELKENMAENTADKSVEGPVFGPPTRPENWIEPRAETRETQITQKVDPIKSEPIQPRTLEKRDRATEELPQLSKSKIEKPIEEVKNETSVRQSIVREEKPTRESSIALGSERSQERKTKSITLSEEKPRTIDSTLNRTRERETASTRKKRTLEATTGLTGIADGARNAGERTSGAAKSATPVVRTFQRVRSGLSAFWLIPIPLLFLTWFGWRMLRSKQSRNSSECVASGKATASVETTKIESTQTEKTSRLNTAEPRSRTKQGNPTARPTTKTPSPKAPGKETARGTRSTNETSRTKPTRSETRKSTPKITESTRSETRNQPSAREAAARRQTEREERSAETRDVKSSTKSPATGNSNLRSESNRPAESNRRPETDRSRSAGTTGQSRTNSTELTKLEGVDSKAQEQLNTAGIRSFADLRGTTPERLHRRLGGAASVFSLSQVSGWFKQANRSETTRSETTSTSNRTTDTPRAARTGESRKDNLTRIKGIGPATEKLLQDSGVHTFDQLLAADETWLQTLLAKAGSTFHTIDPSTWRDQAKFAVNGDWKGLTYWLDDNADRFEARIAETVVFDSEIKIPTARKTSSRPTDSDDLTQIKGIGPLTAKALNSQGITRLQQIATLSSLRIRELLSSLDDNLGLIDSKTWADQAKAILGDDFELTQTEADIIAEMEKIKSTINSKPNERSEARAKRFEKKLTDRE